MPIEAELAACFRHKDKRRGRRYPITKGTDKRDRSEGRGKEIWRQERAGVPKGSQKGNFGTRSYSRGRRNSSPKSFRSPTASWRRILAMIGGVSLGMRLGEEGAGAGMVSWTTWSKRRW
jgi:hypothetical protein